MKKKKKVYLTINYTLSVDWNVTKPKTGKLQCKSFFFSAIYEKQVDKQEKFHI